MDTYGDMVTLLLCFFVLLYSMSTLDQQKWEQLVQSFNPDAIPTTSDHLGNGGEETDPVLDQAEIDAAMEQLYQTLSAYVSEQGAQQNISVTQGDGYVFVSFNETVFFSGDSATLLDSGRVVLDQVSEALLQARDSIDEIRVLGHTAQARPNEPNDPTVDRFLSSNRATTVLLYLQEKNIIDPAKLVSIGYGQWRPISSNATSEERARNRRVELIVTGLSAADGFMDSVTQYYTERGGDAPSTAAPTE